MGCGNSQDSVASFKPVPEVIQSKSVSPATYDDENSSDFYIPLEDASDEVELVDSSQSYPKVKPRSNNDIQETGTSIPFYKDWRPQIDDVIVVDKYDPSKRKYPSIGDIDQRARKAPAAYTNSFEELIGYLTKDVEKGEDPEKLRVRALLVWLCSQDVSGIYQEQTETDSPKGYLNLLAQRKTTYSSVFAALCRKAKIPCVKIQGICKGGRNYKPGSTTTDGMRSSWNAVFINGVWYLIHPFWVRQTLGEQGSQRWIRTFLSGTMNTSKSHGINDSVFEDYFFMCSPKEFVYMCLPDEEKWQLLSQPLSERMFMEQAYLFPPFFGLGFRMRSKRQCVLKAENGVVKISLKTKAKNGNALDLYYELRTLGNLKPSDSEFLRTDKIQRLVTMVRCGLKWKFHINLPLPGSYSFSVFGGPHKLSLLRLADFRLECDTKPSSCILLPFDTGLIGFGPGPTLEDAGLHFPSHTNGIYAVKVNEPITMTFHIDQDELNILFLLSELHVINLADKVDTGKVPVLEDPVVVELLKKRLQFKVTATVPCSGEFLLSIATAKDIEGLSQRNEVCYYILSTLLAPRKETTHQKLARAKLRDVMDEDMRMDVEDNRYQDKINLIQEAIDRCLKQKISPEDEEIEASKIRIQYLIARKEIHDAHLRSHLYVTKNTLKFLQQSPFVYTLRRSIAHLEEVRMDLEDKWKERLIHGFRRKKFQGIVSEVMANKQYTQNK